MLALRNAVIILALAFVATACGSSGGGGGASPASDSACQGSDCSRDETQVPAPLSCGGIQGATCPDGYRCVDDGADDCDPASGADCGGLCILGGVLPDCGGLTGVPCPQGYLCVDDPEDDCAGGPALDCPGVCTRDTKGECVDDNDCPQLDARCSICADGSVSCPRTHCAGGTCAIEVAACGQPQPCAGFAGLPCDDGFECIDDPNDDCHPERGGADCGGICVPKREPPGCGEGGEACPPDTRCVPIEGCEPDAAGTSCPLACMPVSHGECEDDTDCPPLRAPCSECRDGSSACPQSFCEHGRCEVAFPTCPPPVICGDDAGQCKPGSHCSDDPQNACDPAGGDVLCPGLCVEVDPPRQCGGFAGDTCPRGYECADVPSDDCDPNNGADCPGLCQPDGTPECRADDDCPHILAPCVECHDGTFACPIGLCRDGTCAAAFQSCSDPAFCGGIAGFPCPRGFTCVDDPKDDCDPQQGGADCGGVCTREDSPRPCGGFAGETCPASYECADVPDDECDPQEGADCPGTCRPAPSPECRSDAECPQLGAPCRLCADGSAACPLSFCTDGQCQVIFETCREDQ